MNSIGFSESWQRPFITVGGSSGGGGSSSSSSSSSSSTAPLSLVDYLESLNPWALYDASSVVVTGASITELTDLTANARHLTDSQADASRMTLTAGEILGSLTRAFIGDFPGATVMPTKFHAFAVLRTNGVAILTDCFAFCPAGGVNINYAWQMRAEATGNISGFGGLGSTATGHITASPQLAATKYILAEFIYSSSIPAQEWRVNGRNASASYGALPHASFTWTGIRLNISTASTGRTALGYKNLCIFDTTAGNLTRAQLWDIYAAYGAEYPDTLIPARYMP